MELIEFLQLENAELKRKIIELEDELNINSGNSGLTRYREIYKTERKLSPRVIRR